MDAVSELRAARRITDDLFRTIVPDVLYERPIPERHRLIFYLGHLEAFDWNLAARHALGLPPFQPDFDRLFAFGIDPPPGQLPADAPSDWPARAAVEDYNARTREILDGVLDGVPGEMLDTAVEHRLMHAETLAYLLHNLPWHQKIPAAAEPETGSGEPPPNEMIAIPAGWATLGRRSGSGFGWDNEFDEHRVHVPAFLVGKYKVTNGEYLAFVRAGGPVPHYWTRGAQGWRLRAMFGDRPLPMDHPVYVTHTQAAAYAAWRGLALPGEAQWHRAAFGTPWGEEREFPWGSGAPDAVHGNVDFARWDTEAVTANPAGDSAFSASQMVGNGWEWTRSPFRPFPGFRARPYYPGYSADFFDGAHFVLKGGSPRTAARLLRRSFRNWFRGAYPYVYAAFRCVRDQA